MKQHPGGTFFFDEKINLQKTSSCVLAGGRGEVQPVQGLPQGPYSHHGAQRRLRAIY